MKDYYQPERMVLAGVGIDHQQLVDLGKKYFSVPKNEKKNIEQSTTKAVWTGGVVMVKKIYSFTFQTILLHRNRDVHKTEHNEITISCGFRTLSIFVEFKRFSNTSKMIEVFV